MTLLGNGGGRSFQCAPDLSTQMIPSRHSLLPRQRPARWSLRAFGAGSSSSNTAHCSSVRMLEWRFAMPQRKPHVGRN